jgi:hypothetical protein
LNKKNKNSNCKEIESWSEKENNRKKERSKRKWNSKRKRKKSLSFGENWRRDKKS